MARLPSGTVSLLFSDIEGSTALLSRLGPAYADALDAQRQILRKAWADHGGVEMGTEGDSFFVVFETALAAVTAALQAQRELASFEWPGGDPVRVRMGVHTGSPVLHDGGYVGMDVHRAARIAAAAHGGQIVVSAATAALVDPVVGALGALVPLGEHQLEGMPNLELLYHLVSSEADVAFPPLRTRTLPPRLPSFVAPLVGRDVELRQLQTLLSDSRVVMITGPGGVGKTRLAVAAASAKVEEFAGAVHFVDATEATSHADLWAAIASALGIALRSDPAKTVSTELLGRRLLLLLDNVEQVAGADGVVSALASSSTDLRIVATSRRPLRVPGEQEFAVAPLSAEAESGDMRDSAAVQLFSQYAAMANASFEVTDGNLSDIVDVCRQVDGLPLALELVASRVRMLTPSMLAAGLRASLDISAGTSRAARHQSLRQAIGWSHDLLDADHKSAFAALTVFAGPVDFEGCSAVIQPEILERRDIVDLIADLHDLSLVTVTPSADGLPSVSMLRTIRQFGAEQLARTPEEDRTRSAHAEHYAALAQSLGGEWFGQPAMRLVSQADNLPPALEWLLDHRDAARAGWLVEAVWLLRALVRAGRYTALGPPVLRWAERIIEDTQGAGDSGPLSGCRTIAAEQATLLGDTDRAREHIAVALSMADFVGVDDRMQVLQTASWIALEMGEVERARQLAQQAVTIAESAANLAAEAVCVGRLAHVEAVAGDRDSEIRLHERLQVLFAALGDEGGLRGVSHNLAWAAHVAGRTDEAMREMEAIATAVAESHDVMAKIAFMEDFGATLAAAGHPRAAATLLGAADATRQSLSMPRDPLQAQAVGAYFQTARAETPPEAWKDAYQRGRSLSPRDAIEEARHG